MRIKEQIHKILNDEVAKEVWYESGLNETKLNKLLTKAEEKITTLVSELEQKAEEGQKAIAAMNKFRETHNNWFIDYPKVIQKDKFSNDLFKMFNQTLKGENRC
jgi:hypothetical protein